MTRAALHKPNRLPTPQPIPPVSCEEAESRAFFAGMWNGIALGAVIAGAVVTLLLKGTGLAA